MKRRNPHEVTTYDNQNWQPYRLSPLWFNSRKEKIEWQSTKTRVKTIPVVSTSHECRARAEANLLLAQYDFKLPPLLEDSEIEVILPRADQLISWVNDIKEYALQQAISGKVPESDKRSAMNNAKTDFMEENDYE